MGSSCSEDGSHIAEDACYQSKSSSGGSEASSESGNGVEVAPTIVVATGASEASLDAGCGEYAEDGSLEEDSRMARSSSRSSVATTDGNGAELGGTATPSTSNGDSREATSGEGSRNSQTKCPDVVPVAPPQSEEGDSYEDRAAGDCFDGRQELEVKCEKPALSSPKLVRSKAASATTEPIWELMDMASNFGQGQAKKADEPAQHLPTTKKAKGARIDLEQQWRDEISPLPAPNSEADSSPTHDIETRISIEAKAGDAQSPAAPGRGPGAYAIVSPGTRRVNIQVPFTNSEAAAIESAEEKVPEEAQPEPSVYDNSDRSETSLDETNTTERQASAALINVPAILSPMEDDSTRHSHQHDMFHHLGASSNPEASGFQLRNSSNTQTTQQLDLDDDSNLSYHIGHSRDHRRRLTAPRPMLVDAKIVDDSSDEELETRSLASLASVSPFNNRGALFAAILCLLSIVVLLALGLAGAFTSETPSASNGAASILEEIREEGVLKCIYINIPNYFYKDEETGQVGGFCSVWCEAVAAAILGPEQARVQYIDYSDAHSEKEEYHISPIGMTPTMTRNVHKPSIHLERGAFFSTPIFYEPFQIVGAPFYVQCAQEKDFKHTEECADLKMCVLKGSVHESFALSVFSPRRIVVAEDPMEVVSDFVNGTCNLFMMKSKIPESFFRAQGYQGEYEEGNAIYGKGMWSLMTSAEDVRFAEFVNAVVHALLVAEQHNITQFSAQQFPQTDVFGPPYKDMFQNAVAMVGNYGEVYQQHVAATQPREPANQINNGSTGLMFSPPIGQIEATEDNWPLGPNLQRVLERGHLQCGVRFGRPGFATRNITTNSTIGMEIDFCKALAASLHGDAGAVEFIELGDASDGYQKLAKYEVDVVAGATMTLTNDVREPTTGAGYAFSRPYFFGYSKEEDNLCFATRQDDHDWATFVYWVLCATVYAEEEGIAQLKFNDMPLIYACGASLERMFVDAIVSVGNYGEIYNRNLGDLVPRSGRNLLNTGVTPGPQHYPMPGLI